MSEQKDQFADYKSDSEATQRCWWNNCTVVLDSPTELYEHICEIHVGRKSNGTLSLHCGWDGCEATFLKRDHATSHMRVHVAFKPHSCSVRIEGHRIEGLEG
jgi:hypothetical protein